MQLAYISIAFIFQTAHAFSKAIFNEIYKVTFTYKVLTLIGLSVQKRRVSLSADESIEARLSLLSVDVCL